MLFVLTYDLLLMFREISYFGKFSISAYLGGLFKSACVCVCNFINFIRELFQAQMGTFT